MRERGEREMEVGRRANRREIDVHIHVVRKN